MSDGNGQSTALAPWGSRTEVREIDERIKLMLPNADRLNQSQRMALAQASIMHGLDPFNGEIWMIPNHGLMIGIKGLRKKAHQQVKGNYWVEFSEIIDLDQRKRWGIPSDALAFEARLFDSENIRTFTEAVGKLLDAKIPWEAVQKMTGSKPYTTGVGVLRGHEKTRMERVQCAMKRAEADATKRRFDVPFGIEINVDTEEAIEGEWAENVDAQIEPDDVPLERPLLPDQLRDALHAKADKFNSDDPVDGKTRGIVAGNIEQCFAGESNTKEKRYHLLDYLFGVTSMKSVSDSQTLALKAWLNAKPDTGGHWTPDGMAIEEAQSVIANTTTQV